MQPHGSPMAGNIELETALRECLDYCQEEEYDRLVLVLAKAFALATRLRDQARRARAGAEIAIRRDDVERAERPLEPATRREPTDPEARGRG